MGRAMVALVAMVLASACASEPLSPPERRPEQTATLPAADSDTRTPVGHLSVAYPSEPAGFLPGERHDVAAQDLAALWGLPLLRLDEAGQVRRGLVEEWDVVGPTGQGWVVELTLRSGTWTDGSAVDAEDVVATLQAWRDRDPARFGVVDGVEEVDEHTVALRFARAHAAWPDLLVEGGTVLPAEVWSGGADEYADDIPVSGGWFGLVAYEPGLRMVLEAHADGPMGAPGLERIEVLFTPGFETARGLLEDGTVDMLLGYLALNGVPRSVELEGVQAGSPLGGTTVALQFRPGGALGGEDMAERRRGVVETVDVDELVEGMLGPNGAAATSLWPGTPGPPGTSAGEVRENQQFAILFPRGSEVLSFTARSIQRDLVSRGMAIDLVGEPAPRYAEVVASERDVALAVHRTPRRPSLAPWIDDVALARAADAAPPSSTEATDGLAAVAEQAHIAPLFRIGVLHAWKAVEGVRPSSWVGVGFWNVGQWQVTGG